MLYIVYFAKYICTVSNTSLHRISFFFMSYFCKICVDLETSQKKPDIILESFLGFFFLDNFLDIFFHVHHTKKIPDFWNIFLHKKKSKNLFWLVKMEKIQKNFQKKNSEKIQEKKIWLFGGHFFRWTPLESHE